MFSGRRLTAVLATLLAGLLVAGAAAAWSVGRSRLDEGTGAPGYAAGPSSDRTVRLGPDAARHPRADEVRELLQQYFDGINDRDYVAWRRSVATEQAVGQTAADWADAYSSTADSNLVAASIDDDPLRVRLMFSSTQDLSRAPASLRAGCIDWDVTYRLGDEDGRLVLTGIDPSAQSMTPCA